MQTTTANAIYEDHRLSPDLPVEEATRPGKFRLQSLMFYPPAKTFLLPDGTSKLAPDLNRRKEPLEAYPLESINMVGTLQKDKAIYALLRTPLALLDAAAAARMAVGEAITNLCAAPVDALETVKLSANWMAAAGHNGVASCIRHLGEQFVRARLGIGPKQYPGQDLADHVLGRFPDADLTNLTQRIPDFIKNLEILLSQGLPAAQNLTNRKSPSP